MKPHPKNPPADREPRFPSRLHAGVSSIVSRSRLTVLALVCALATGAHAASTILVTSTADDGSPGTLRAALAIAADGDVIDATGITGTIVLLPQFLTSSQLGVTKSVGIVGPGPDKLTIDGNHTSRVFRIFPGLDVIIDGFTIANGHASGAPPASFPPNNGGGIYNDHSSLTVRNCVIRENAADDSGGGVYNDGGSSGDATVEIRDSTLSGNTSIESGGGISNDGSSAGNATLTIANCILSGNSVNGISGQQFGGAIYNNGTNSGNARLTVTASTLSGNFSDRLGGAICNDAREGHTAVQIIASTLSGNTADSGGGIFVLGKSDNDPSLVTLSLVNCTLSGNSATGVQSGGGAVFNRGATLEIISCTLSGNSAAGGGISANGRVRIGNTILKAGSPGVNIHVGTAPGDRVISLGFNLSSDDGGGVLTAPNDQINTDPLLGPLADNGGPTRTHLPLPGSPAIDRGSSDSLAPFGLTTDQRGGPRTVDDASIANAFLGDGTDIGAVEVVVPNHAPVAKAKNVTVLAGPDGTANVSIDDGSYDPDAGDTITLVQTPAGPYPIGATLVTLTVTDSHGASSSATATVTVQGVADLSISTAVVSGQGKPGQLMVYTIVVRNVGPNAASGIVVNDAVPQGTTFTSATPAPVSAPPVDAGGTVTWNVGSLASGATATLTLTVKVSLKGNTLVENTATVASASSDPNTANNTATVTSKRNPK